MKGFAINSYDNCKILITTAGASFGESAERERFIEIQKSN
jgi:hypothetical protein